MIAAACSLMIAMIYMLFRIIIPELTGVTVVNSHASFTRGAVLASLLDGLTMHA
jgi:hypothetical protein